MSTVSDVAPTPESRRARRHFTEEFRAGAVRLVIDEHRSIAYVARELDLTESALRPWVNRASADDGNGGPGAFRGAEEAGGGGTPSNDAVRWRETSGGSMLQPYRS